MRGAGRPAGSVYVVSGSPRIRDEPLPGMPAEGPSPLPQWIRDALADDATRERYWSKVRVATDSASCWYWTGAISAKGHGRFWVGAGRVVIAHRFGYALAHPTTALPAVVSHGCDNPLCQSPLAGHMTASTHAANRAEYASRRYALGSPLRDLRGARGRARALRDAARDGGDLDAVTRQGVRPVDRDQPPLW